MEHNKIILLAQLIESLDTTSQELEKAYNTNNKKDFEKFKAVLLEFQGKIMFLLR